jgi:hypothetical protein
MHSSFAPPEWIEAHTSESVPNALAIHLTKANKHGTESIRNYTQY